MEYYSAIKGTKSSDFVVIWMDLESVIQSVISQKEKNKYRILTHIYGTQKNGTDEPSVRAGIEIQTQRTDLWTQWGKGRLGRIERVALTCIHYMCKIDSSWEAVVQHREVSLVLCDDLEGWDGEGGKEAQEGGDMQTYVCIQLVHFVVQQN